tara:strand:+ start:393 stop:1487 length:1095 start_codon:yes stop_codon:yes gene_type:complete
MMKINPHLIVISTFLFLGCTESEKTEKTNLDNLVIRNKILEEAIPGEKLILKGINPQNSYSPNSGLPYTGWAFYEYPNGQIKRIDQYERGRQHGLTVRWYSNGQKNFERYFIDGKFITYRVWKPNGKKCPVTKIDEEGTGVIVSYQELLGKEVFRTIRTYENGKRISKKTEKANVELDIRGEWVGDRKYINDYFGFVTEVPVEWHLKKGTNDEFKKTTTEFLGGDDVNLKALFKSSIEKTYTVFQALRHPPGTPGKTNPSVMMLIENIGHLLGIKSAKDYLLVLEDNLKLTNKKFSFAPEVIKVELGGVEFWMRNLSFTIGVTEVNKKIYARINGNYILAMGVTTISEDDENTVSELTRTIRIN